MAAYRERNRIKLLKQTKEYQTRNRQNGTDYYTTNAEAIRERKRIERHANLTAARAKERERRKRYLDAVREAQKRWLARNPTWKKIKKHRRRALQLGAAGSHTVFDIERIYEAQHGKCAICFNPLRKRFTIDHIVALSRGGSNDPSNLQLACRDCNARKWAKDPIIFAHELGRLL